MNGDTGGEDEDQNVRRQVHPKNIDIDIDADELSLVVTYIVDITYLDRHGAPMDSEKKKERKKVKLAKHIKPHSSVPKMASEVMKKCRYIHDSKREDVERAIQELQHIVIRDELRAKTKAEGDWWKGEQEV